MELKRVIALDSRAANEKAIQLYGENVLVISSERVDNQTELIVAVDLEPAFSDNEEEACEPMPGQRAAALSVDAQASRDTAGELNSQVHAPGVGIMSFSDWLQQGVAPQTVAPTPAKSSARVASRVSSVRAPAVAERTGVVCDVDAGAANTTDAVNAAHDQLRSREVIALVREEFETLRKELLSAQAFAAAQRRISSHTGTVASGELMQAMADCGVPLSLRAQLMAGLETCDDAAHALDAAEAALARLLSRCADTTEPSSGRRARGSRSQPPGPRAATGPCIKVLVGPSGCGKTSMAVRLAGQAAAAHGMGSQAIVSFRDTRPGAWSQLQTLAALVGVDCWRAQNDDSLKVILNELTALHTVWVDTGGLDFMKTAKVLNELCPHALMHAVLPMDVSFTSAQRVLAQSPVTWASLMVTKADESGHAWPLISTLCANPLAISHIGSGAHVSSQTLAFDPESMAAQAFSPLREPLTVTSQDAGESDAMALAHSTLASLAQRAATVEVPARARATGAAARAAPRKRQGAASETVKR